VNPRPHGLGSSHTPSISNGRFGHRDVQPIAGSGTSRKTDMTSQRVKRPLRTLADIPGKDRAQGDTAGKKGPRAKFARDETPSDTLAQLDRLLFQVGDCGRSALHHRQQAGSSRLREHTKAPIVGNGSPLRLRQRGLCLGAPSRARPETVAGSIRRRETDADSA